MAKLLPAHYIPALLKNAYSSCSGKALKTLCFLLLNLAVASMAYAQTVIDVSGTSVNTGSPFLERKPYGNYFNQERSAAIYLGTEINTTGSITQIGFFLEGVNTPATTDVRIYLQQESVTTYPTPFGGSTGEPFPTVFARPTPPTLVFTGTISSSTFVNGVGTWIMVTLDTPFSYNHTAGNLEVFVFSDDPANSTTTGDLNPSAKDFLLTNAGANRFQVWEADATDPANFPENNTAAPGFVTPFRPAIRLVFGNAPQTCAAPTVVGASNVTTNSASITFSGGDYQSGNNFVIEYGPTSTWPSGTTTTGTLTTLPATLSGLASGTGYTFVVRVTCTNGVTSGNSPTGTFTTQAAACNPATNLAATNITQNSATITFTESTTGAPGNFAVQYSTNSTFTFGNGTTVTGPPYNISGLSPNTTYYFIVRKDCGGGSVADASSQFTTSPAPCNPATNLQATNVTQTSATITFDQSTTGATGNYAVQYSTNSSFTFGNGTPVTGPPYNISGLSPSTTYYYIVRKDCGGGNVADASSQFTTLAAPTCATPTDLSISNLSQTSARLNFTDNTAAEPGTYTVQIGSPGFTFGTGTPVSGPPYDATGLTANTTYEFALQKNCTNGATGSIQRIQFTTTATPTCAAPTSVTGTPTGTNTANITFSGGDYQSGNNFVIEYGPTSTWPSGTTTTGTLTTLPATLSGLASGTGYTFVVRVTCTNGVTSGNSPTGTFTTQAAACNPATNLAATNITQNSATITFTESTTGAPGNFAVQYSTNSTFTFGNGTTVTGPPYNISGLSPNTTYYFIVRKDCGGGSVADASSQFTTSPAPCNPATNLQATNVTQTSATITFDQSTTGATGNYAVQYSTNSSFTFGNGTTVTGPPYNISGLSPSTTYYYIVRKDCGGGNVADASSQFTTPAPLTCDAPTNLTVSNITSNSAQLNFTPSNTGAGGTYTIVYEETSGANQVTVPGITGTSYTATGLSPSTNYRFTVQKNCNNSTNSSVVGPVSFSTIAAPPQPCDPATNLAATNITQTSATLTFTPSSTGASGTYIVQYGPVGFANGSGTTVSGPAPYNISGLTAGTSYDFTVQKDCGANTSTIVRANFQTLSPPACLAPTTVNGTATSPTTADITFSGGTSTSAYIIEYGPSATFPSGTTIANASSSPASISGLTPNTAYTFVVRTDCGSGNVSGNSTQGTFTTPNVTVCLPGTWEGTVSSDWHTAGNWCNGIVPNGATNVIIPAGTPNMPVISANAAANNLTISAGATLTLADGLLTVNGIYLNSGTLIDNGLGSLAFTGITPQIVGKPGSTITFLDLTAGPGGILLAGPVSVRRVLTLNGNLTTNNFPFMLLADAAIQAMVVNTNGVVIGEATFEKYINPGINGGLGYRHLSSPVQNATINQLNEPNVNLVVNPAYNSNPTPGTTRPFPTIYRYNETRVTGNQTFTYGWESPASLSDPMPPGVGFTVNMPPVEVDITGTLNTGPISVGPLSNAGNGWHLSGNPYPSPIDWDLVTVPPGMEGAVYVFRSTGQYSGFYVSYTNGVGSGTDLIPAMQGFFVRVISGNPTLAFNNSNRVTTYQNPALYKQNKPETRPLVQLSLQNTITQLPDKLYVYFENGATAGTDSRYDAHKIYNIVDVPSFYSLAGTDALSVNGLPANIPGTVVPLGAYVPQPGTYTINAEQIINFNPNQDIFLEDLELGITQNLRQQTSYTFTATQNNISGRFVLRFGPAGVSGTAETGQLAKVLVYPNPNQGVFTIAMPAENLPTVEATLFNAIGQRVWNRNFRTNGLHLKETINLEKLAKGVYSLRLETASGPVIKRIVIE